MIRHPSENFIKSLMVSSHASAGDNNWVAIVIEQMQWPRPAADYLAWLRADIMSRMPAGFRTDDKYHRPSARYLRDEGIYGLFFAERAEREASEIIMNFRVRSMVEPLLLGRLPEMEIAKKINARLSTHIPVATIERYHHYYWKVELLRVEDWAVLFDGNYEAKENALAIAQVGPALALHKLGFQQNVDSKSMLRIMQEALFFDLMQWKTQPLSGEKTKAMTAIARSAVMVDEQLSSSDSALKDSLKAFEQFRMKHGESRVTGLNDLAPAGNFTGSGARLLDAPKDNDEEIA
jgi:hypothetical protein